MPARRLLCTVLTGAALAGCGGEKEEQPDRAAATPAGPCAAYAAPEGTLTGGRALECTVEDRRFVLYVPEAAGDGPAPLVLALHGVGGPAATPEATLEASRLDRTADAHGFLLALPEGEGGAWDDAPGSRDVAFALDVVDAVATEHPVDPARVHATGWSGGGFMVHRLGCDAAGRFAAIAVLHAPPRGPCEPERPIGVLQLVGADDDVLPAAGGSTPDGGELPPLEDAMRRRRAAGGRIELERVARGTHTWWTEEADGFDASGRIWAFFEASAR